MERYQHGGDIYGNTGVVLDFSVNTNPLGMPEEIRRAVIDHVDEYARYPDPNCRELRSVISGHEQIPYEWILCGNGAADLIYRLCRALKPRKALVCAPTFSEYERALEQMDCQVIHHALSPENQFELTMDITKQLAPGVDILFLCHPNNPTGRLISGEVLERIIRAAGKSGTVVVIDECFLNFTGGVSGKAYLKAAPKLVILKAFTKMYSIAGLRLGYLLTADSELLNKTDAAGQSWSVSIPAQRAGIAAFTCGDWQEQTRRLVGEERALIGKSLSAVGIRVFPSDANFLLFRCEQPLYEPLLKRGILIRSCGNYIGLDRSYYRVSVKTRPENIRLIQAVREIVYG